MGEELGPEFKRIRLAGARFNGGRLPVDSLSELQNYQEIVRIAAIAEWQREHPGETAPSDLRDSIRFTIDHIDEGSADVFLVLEQHDAYVQQQTVAQDAADAVIAAAFSEADIPTLSSLSPEQDDEFRKAVAQLGSTLVPEQSLEIYPDETQGVARSECMP